MTLARISNSILAPISRNMMFFSFMSLLGLVCVLFERGYDSRFYSVFELAADLYILCALLLLIPPKARKYVRGTLCVVLYFVAVADMACYVRLGSTLCPIHIQLLQQTDEREAREAINAYLSWRMLASPLGGVFGIIILHAACAILHKQCGSSLSAKTGTISSKLRHCGRMRGIFATCVAATVSFGFISTIDGKEFIYYDVILGLDNAEMQKIKEFTPKTRYYLPIYRFIYAITEHYGHLDTLMQQERSSELASVTSCSHMTPHIALIIGESYNRHHSNLYGYARTTTPLQFSRTKRGEIAVFTDVVTPWNITYMAIQDIFSTYCHGMDGSWASYPPFPLLFRLAGYRTTFLCNQFVAIRHTYNCFDEDMFITNPAMSEKMFDARNETLHEYDIDLLSDYDQLCHTATAQEPDRPTLDIFHLIGMHANFSNRFPARWRRYKGSEYDRPDLCADDRQVIADYDNATLYNDYVTDRILSLYETRDAVVIFFPDHGERVCDNHTADWGRSLVWTTDNVRQQFEIPFWIYASPLFRENHRDLWQRINDATQRPMMTDALPHLLMHLAGIESTWYSAKYDVLSDDYDSARRRVLNGEREYYPFD